MPTKIKSFHNYNKSTHCCIKSSACITFVQYRFEHHRTWLAIEKTNWRMSFHICANITDLCSPLDNMIGHISSSSSTRVDGRSLSECWGQYVACVHACVPTRTATFTKWHIFLMARRSWVWTLMFDVIGYQLPNYAHGLLWTILYVIQEPSVQWWR